MTHVDYLIKRHWASIYDQCQGQSRLLFYLVNVSPPRALDAATSKFAGAHDIEDTGHVSTDLNNKVKFKDLKSGYLQWCSIN